MSEGPQPPKPCPPEALPVDLQKSLQSESGLFPNDLGTWANIRAAVARFQTDDDVCPDIGLKGQESHRNLPFTSEGRAIQSQTGCNPRTISTRGWWAIDDFVDLPQHEGERLVAGVECCSVRVYAEN